MNIVGDVADMRGLRGNKTIEELLSLAPEEWRGFRSSAPIMPWTRPREMREIQMKVRKGQEAVRKAIDVIPYMSGDAMKSWLEMQSLVANYIAFEFEAHYDLLSSDLFKLEREICTKASVRKNNGEVKEEEEEVTFRVPLFATSGPYGSEWTHTEQWSTGTPGRNLKEYAFTIKSKTPPLSIDAEQKMREAKARAFGIYAKAVVDKKIGRAFSSGLGECVHFRTYWIPKPSELEITGEVEEKDPILVATIPYNFRPDYGDPDPDRYRFYLISNWDINGEEPYEHYLAEFTERKAG